MKQMARRQAETMGWPILEPIAAQGVPRALALTRDVCVAGAREHVHLKLPSPLVSRTHALFVADRDTVYLRDLASRNHTYLNDEPIREAVLRNGDVVGLGPVTFRCQSGFDRPFAPEEALVPPAELQRESDDSRFTIQGRTTLIGSRNDCDIQLAGDGVDPAHAVIYQRQGRRFIRDLRPNTDTLVNGEPVTDIELRPGDRIQIGDANLIYQTTMQVEAAADIPLTMDEVDSPGDTGAENEAVAREVEVTPSMELDQIPSPADGFGLPDTFDVAAPSPEVVDEPGSDVATEGDLIPLEDASNNSQVEEKMTELLGELAETVAKVQSTWEEIREESGEHRDSTN